MKTLEQILKQDAIYLNDWESKIDVVGDFEGFRMSEKEFNAKSSPWKNEAYWLEEKEKMAKLLSKYEKVNILFASYCYENYSGDAFVLFERDGELYEVNGSHCSCHGLDGQWDEEETNLVTIKHRLNNGRLGKEDYCGNVFYKELCSFLGVAS